MFETCLKPAKYMANMLQSSENPGIASIQVDCRLLIDLKRIVYNTYTYIHGSYIP